MNTFSHLWQHLVKFFLKWEIFQIQVVEKIRTHILCSIRFFRKSCRLWDNIEKCDVDRGHKWRHSMAHTRCMLDRRGYTHARARTCTLSRAHAPTNIRKQIGNCYWSSMAKMIRERALTLRSTYITCLVCCWCVESRMYNSSFMSFQTSAAVEFLYLLFWVFTQRHFLVVIQYFEKTCQSHRQGGLFTPWWWYRQPVSKRCLTNRSDAA